MRLLTYTLLFLVTLLLISCDQTAPAAQSQTPSSPPTSAPTATVAQHVDATPVPSAVAASDVLAVYHRIGGFAGTDETLTIHGNGTLELVNRTGQVQRSHVAPADLASLQQALANSVVVTAQPQQQMTVADGFAYEITLPAPDGTHRVIKTVDGATNPPALQAMLDTLDHIRTQMN